MNILPTRITRRSAMVAAAALPLAAQAQSQSPPGPVITLVVPFGPGGIADLTARAVAKEMGAILRQPIVVDNKPSAGAIVGSQQVARAAPDGLTLLLMSNANAVSAGLFKKLPFDAAQNCSRAASSSPNCRPCCAWRKAPPNRRRR